jgi:hypothetical protein
MSRLTLVESILDGGESGDDTLYTSQYEAARGLKEVQEGKTSVALTAGLVISPVFLSWLQKVSTARDHESYRRNHSRDVKVNANEDPLALELDVLDGELVGEGHGDSVGVRG